ncbi:DUF5320 domain-containing protein [Candidatus Latescibacterota bacterium]
MPRGDGTGPDGMGPMTGRGAGKCTGIPVPTDTNPSEEQDQGTLRGGSRGGRGSGKGPGSGQGNRRNRQ